MWKSDKKEYVIIQASMSCGFASVHRMLGGCRRGCVVMVEVHKVVEMGCNVADKFGGLIDQANNKL